MRLQFVLGRAKSGKSHLMYQQMIEKSEKNPDTHYVFVVPEQVSLSTQQELVSVHPRHALMNVEVMSFKSLAYQVFEESGMRIPTVLDDVGKSMLLRKALISVNDELIIYKGSSRHPGFIDKMKSMIAELSQYGVDEAVLSKAAGDMEENAQLSAKLHDILLISKAFDSELSQNYITSESIIPECTKCVKDSEYLKNSVLIFDGFSDFTPTQYELMAELLRTCKEVYVVLDMSREMFAASRGENALFHLSRLIIDELSELAEKSGVTVLEPLWLSEKTDYYKSDEMRHLMRTYEQKPAVFADTTRDIFYMETENPTAEVEHVIAQILTLAREEDYAFGDMAIITTDKDIYGGLLEKRLLQAQIPFFSDNRHSLMGNIGVEIVLSALRVTEENFSYESVFRYLKCGLFSDMEIIDLMENYCIAAGVRGRKNYERAWEWRPGFISEDELARINEEKSKLLAPVFKLNEGIKGRLTVGERLSALREFLNEISFAERMEELGREINDRGEAELAQEYMQVAGCLDMLFTQMEDMIGTEKMSLKEMCDCLETSFDAMSVGVTPPGLDNLVIADMRRSRLENVKAIFVLGMNEGVFPAQKSGAGVLSDIDREELNKRDVKLAPTAKRESFTDKFYIYRAFTKPECKLYLSYSRQSNDGKKLHPSYVFGQIKRIFPNITCIPEDEGIYHVRQGLETLAKDDFKGNPLYEFYRSSPEYIPLLNMIESGKNVAKSDMKISVRLANNLFGTPRITSVSHLEKFAACQMSHFLRYGLHLNERQEHTLRSLDFGNLYHDAFDIVFREAKKSGENIAEVSRTRLEELTDIGIKKALENFSSDLFESSSKNEYILTRMRDVLKLNLEAVISQLSAGKYKPIKTEMAFGMRGSEEFPPLEIKDSPFALNGKIDRLDEAVTEDGQKYVRVVDYKTGGTTFDYTKLVNGLQLQLMLYLSAAVDDGKATPAGGFYYHVDEPIVELTGDVSGLSDEQIRAMVHEKQLEALRLNGLLNTDGESLELFETGLSPNTASSVLAGLKLKKEGGFTATSPVISGKMMNSLMDTAKSETRKLGEEILKGEIDTNPYLYSQKTPCQYCEYSQICGFNTAFPGYQYRRIKKESMLKEEKSDGSKLD